MKCDPFLLSISIHLSSSLQNSLTDLLFICCSILFQDDFFCSENPFEITENISLASWNDFIRCSSLFNRSSEIVTYPLSSLSICCCLLNFKNSLRFSTRSLSLANSLKISWNEQIKDQMTKDQRSNLLPGQHSQYEIEHEEWTEDDKRNEIRPVVCWTDRIIRLQGKEVMKKNGGELLI